MKSIILFSLVATLAVAEPPIPSPYGRMIALQLPSSSNSDYSKIVNQRLLDRVADIISQGGDGSERPQSNEGASIVDSDLFDRIARIVSQNEGQAAPPAGQGVPNEAYGPPSPALSSTYGAPPPQIMKLIRGQIELGSPEPVRRIASFDLEDEEGANEVSTSYGSPSGYTAASRGSRSGRIQFVSEPQTAESIAAFDIPDAAAPQVQPQQGRYKQ